MAEDERYDGAGDRQPAKDRLYAATPIVPGAKSATPPESKLVQVTGSGLSGPFIRRPVMTVLLTLSVIVAGMATYGKLAVNDLPSVDYPVIQVTCSYPGADPTTMAITLPRPWRNNFCKFPD